MALALDRLLRPRSVAVVGASDKPGSLGAAVLANLERFGFEGNIHLINPKRAEIGGRPCLAGIEQLPNGVDAAVLAIPKAGVLDAVRALADRGVGAAVIFSAGFAEGGEEGLAEQRELAAVAAAAGMVVEGPNCLGLVNFVDGVPLTFIETAPAPIDGRPAIGLVSQSGAIAAVVGTTSMSRDLPLSYSVSTGNEAGSGVEDYVDHLIDDPATAVIGMVVEQFRKPARFLAAARRARAAGKPIILLHPGRSSAARASAATHTGALAGDYAVMRAKVERAGVVLAETLEELGDCLELALRCGPIGPRGTIAIGESGAFKALTLDLAEAVGLHLPPAVDADSPALRAALPPFVPVSNPVDMTAQGLVEPDLYARLIEAVAKDDRFDSVVLGIIQTDAVTCAIKFPAIIDAVRKLDAAKPIICAGLDEGAPIPPDYVSTLRSLGVPYFPTAERVFRATARLARRVAADGGQEAPLAQALPEGEVGVVPEYRSKALLAPLGLRFPESRLATSLDEATAAADAIGYPVVLKAQSADLSHKSDAGGVIVGLADRDALASGWARLHDNVAHHRPGLRLDGVLVEAMGRRGLELIVGGRTDPDWGPVVLVGLGGVQTEVYGDVRLLTPDLSRAEIVAELNKLAGAALLHGFRGEPARDVDAVAHVVERVGALLRANPAIREIDLNPVVALADGEGAVVLDALMLVGEPAAD